MALHRPAKIAAWTGGILLGLMALIVVVLMTFDWNRLKPWINKRVSEATGREFAINGDLSVRWRDESDEKGWRGWIPWPYFVANDLTLGNPDWVTQTRQMAGVKQVAFSVNPLPLLNKHIVIPNLTLRNPDIFLIRDKEGDNNWTFKKKDEESKWKLDLQTLALNEGTVRVEDAPLKLSMKADINSYTEPNPNNYRIQWKVSGTYNKAPLSGNGKAGSILSLQQSDIVFPLQGHIESGKTAITAEGTITKPSQLAGLDLRLKLAGASMAHLYPFTGIVLPETPAFSTEGHLVGEVHPKAGSWKYEKFTGKVGGSDLAGTLQFDIKKPRSLLHGSVVSNVLRLKDLGPVVGADSNASKAKRDAPAQPSSKLLPTEPFKTERWDSIDADVKFTGKKIVRDKAIPINDLSTHLKLTNGVLLLDPLNFGMAGGTLASRVKLDSQAKPVKADVKLSARHLKLKELFPAVEQMKASIGQVNGEAALSGTGNSIASLLGSANGEVKAAVNEGAMSKLVLEAIGLNVGSVVMTKLFGDKQVEINCVASDFVVHNGLMEPRIMLLDTPDSTIKVEGKIDLKDEQLDLVINPENKKVRLLSLRSPIYVQGAFKKPDIKLDKKTLAFRAGGALALGLAAPVATALAPLTDLGPGKDSPCHSLLVQASKKPEAPPPGKTADKKTEKEGAPPS